MFFFFFENFVKNLNPFFHFIFKKCFLQPPSHGFIYLVAFFVLVIYRQNEKLKIKNRKKEEVILEVFSCQK